MEGNKKDNTIYYQERQHHRQQLRQHIKPETIDMLEINHNPSLVTRKACESVYQDQLEREIAARNILKERTTHYGDSLSNYADQGLTNKAKSNSIYKDTGMRERENQFRDYYVEKDTKVKDHIDHNYDGGSSFFRASEQHEYLRKKYQMETTETLKAQMNSKMQEVNNDKDRREKELQIRQEQLTRLKFIADIEKKQNEKLKQNSRTEYIRQIEEDKNKRMSHNDNNSINRLRHNPITNPIEYHIDNPYILKQIQQKSKQARY